MDVRQITEICTQSHVIPVNAVTLSYSSEYGTAPQNKTVDVGYELTADDLPELTADGHVFSMWTVGGEEATAGTAILSDTELIAVWES